MPDYFDELINQVEAEGTEEEDESSDFDLLIDEVIGQDEDRGGDIGLSGTDTDAPGTDVDPVIRSQPTATDKPEQYTGPYQAQFRQGVENFEKFGDKTVGQTLVGETEDVGEAVKHAVTKRPVEAVRHGLGTILETGAAHAEADPDTSGRRPMPNLDLWQEATKRITFINPEAPVSAVWDEYDQLLAAKKKEVAASFRKAKNIIGTEVSESKFEGGWAKDVDDAATGFVEYTPAMVTAAIGGPLGVSATVATTYAQLFGGKYEEGLKKYENKEQAFKVAFIHAATGTPVESLGNILQLRFLKGMFKNMKIGKGLEPSKLLNLAKNAGGVLQGSITEGVEEGAQTYTEAFADVIGDAPPGATSDEIFAMYKHVIGTDTFKKTRDHGIKLGAIGGGMLGLGGAAVAGSIDLQKLIKAKWAAFRADAHFLDSVEIADQKDLEEARADTEFMGDADVDKVESEGLQSGMSPETLEKNEAEKTAVAERKNAAEIEAVRASEAALQKEQQAAEQHEAQIAQAKQEEAAAVQQAQSTYVDKLSIPANTIAEAQELDNKILNDAAKAVSVEEDSIKKLKGIAYDLRHGKELKEAPFEQQATAESMALIVDQKVHQLEVIEEQEAAAKAGEKTEGQRLEEEFLEPTEPTEAEEAKEAEVDELFSDFKEDEAAAAEERIAEEKAEKDRKTDKESKTKKTFGRRAFARRKAAGISEAKSKKMDEAFAAQRKSTAEKAKIPTAEKAKTPPKDLQAALRLEDGTILKGTSHYEILGNLTDEQIEKVDFANVKRGFTSGEDAFLTVDESTAKYGITKSQQIPSTKKLTPSEVDDPAAVFLRTDISEKEFEKEAALNKKVADRHIAEGNIPVGDGVRWGEFAELNKILNTNKAGYSPTHDVKYVERVASKSFKTGGRYGKPGKRHFGVVVPAKDLQTDGEHYVGPDTDTSKFKFIIPGQVRLLSFDEARGHQLEAFGRKQKGKHVVKRLTETREARSKPVKGALTKDQADERISRIDTKYTKGKKIVVVESTADLNPAIRAEADDVPAFYHVAPGEKLDEGTIYIVANKTKNNLELVINLWHEMGHVGLAKLAKESGLGEDLTPLLKDVKKKYGDEIIAYQFMYGLSEDVAAEEVLVNEFERGNDRGLMQRFRRLLLKIATRMGFKFESDAQLTAIIDNMRLSASGKLIRLGQKGHAEARTAVADGMATVRKAIKPVMIKQAIKLGPLLQTTVDVAKNLNKIQAIDVELRKQIREQVFRGPEDIVQVKKDIKAGRKKPTALRKRLGEVKRAKEQIAAGKEVTQSTKTNVFNYNSALRNRPDLLAKVKEFEKSAGVTLLVDGELASAPIEQRTKPGNGRFKTLPKFGGFSRSITQTYLDRMDAPSRERFRTDMVRYVEYAYTNKLAPKTFDIGLENVGGTSYNISSAVRAASKTEGAINLNGMCPMFYVGSHGCYFDGCYVTGIGKGATNVNVHDSAIYTGELLQLDQESIDNLNEVGGLRMNGIGDTSLQDYSQWRDVFKHAAMRGLKLKVITKQEATFEIFDKLMNDGDTRIAKLAGDTVVQPSLDPYWIPVEEDGRAGSFATEMGLTGKPKTAEKVIELYRSIGRDAKLINGIVHRKYGFSGEQLKSIAKKYPKIKVQPRVVVGTKKEIAEFALKQPEMLQTWMHAKVRPGMFSDIHGRTLTEGEVGNFEDRIDIRKDLLGEWIIEAQEANGDVVQNDRYTAVESYIKENYSKEDANKIFSTLAGQTKKTASALCCTSGASKNACNNCTSTCATGTYHSGTNLEALAIRNAELSRFTSAEMAASGVTKKALMPVAPKKTVIGYKLARVKKSQPGKLFPLFVGSDTAFEFGTWVEAEAGDTTGKAGKVKSKIGPLAYRPGWHSGDMPVATHIGGRKAGETVPSFRKDDEVWVEVSLPDDVDWQSVANERAKLTKAGKPNLATAHITDQVPLMGFYRYKTNATMTGEWLISGGLKVNRILTDAEVDTLNKKAGFKDLPRKAPFNPQKWGLEDNLYQKPSEVTDAPITKKVTRAIPTGEIVQPAATDAVKLAYKPHFVAKKVADKTELLKRSYLRERRKIWIDQFDVLKQLEQGKDIDATLSGYTSQTLISNLPAMLDMFLEYGNINMVEKWMRVEKGGQGIAPILKELGDNATPFFERLTAKSGQELLDKYGKQNLWGQDSEGKKFDDQGKIDEIMSDTQELYDANTEQWDRLETRLREINRAVTDFMRDTGLISKQEHADMRETYIPFFRQIEDTFGQEFTALVPKQGKAIKTTQTLKGNDQLELGDPINNLISAYSFFINEGLRNLTRTKTLKLAKELDLIERVHKGQKGGVNVLNIRVKGESIHYRVKNSALYDAMNTSAQTTVNVPGWLRAPKRMLTWGVTIMPRFRMFNILRDTLSAAFMNKSMIPFVDTARGLYHTMARSKEFVRWTSTGGNFTGSYSKRDIVASTQKGIEKLKRKLTGKKRNGVREFASAMYNLYDRLGEMSESANRMGIFLAEQRQGASVTKAAFESRDLLDFHRKGSGTIAQFLIQTVPFLNARLQGLDKLARSANLAKENKTKGRFWAAAAMMLTASLALHYQNEDRPEYKKLSDWEKIAYWHFWVGDEHFRIPTPFEVGSIFGAMPVALWETLKGDRDAKRLGTFTLEILLNTFAFNPIPHLFKPILEQMVNFDFFRWSPIEGMADQLVEPELRVGSTGPTARLIAKKLPKMLNAGPKRIEKAMRDYLGGFGDVAMNVMDMATQYIDSNVDPAGTTGDSVWHAMGVEGFWPSVKAQKEPSYTRYTEAYYKLNAAANEAYNSMRIHNDTLTGKLLVKKEAEFGKMEEVHKILKPYRKDLSSINKELIAIRRDNNMSPKQKLNARELLLKDRNSTFYEAVEEARSFLKQEAANESLD